MAYFAKSSRIIFYLSLKSPWNMPKSFSILALVVLAGAVAADFPRPWVRGPGEKWYLLAETAGMSWPDARRLRF